MTKIRKRDEISDFARLITDWRSMAVVHAVYEHDSIRYTQLERILELSPTILSQKLSQLTKSGVINRHNVNGSKGVIYSPTALAKDIVCAYHILEGVSVKFALAQDEPANGEGEVCRLVQDGR